MIKTINKNKFKPYFDSNQEKTLSFDDKDLQNVQKNIKLTT
ncbi:hypothetical protein PSOL_06050 [Candidatus Phytoplasma solani]